MTSMFAPERMNIGLDIDGVVADFALEFTRIARILHGHVEVKGIGGMPDWGFKRFMTRKEIDAVWDKIYSSNDFWYSIPRLFTSADQRSLHRLNADHNLIWITSRSGKDCLGQTKRWLKDMGLPAFENVFLAGENKGKFITEGLPAAPNIMLDDSPSQIKNIREVGVPCIIRDWPYNRIVSGARVGSIAEFENVINTISSGQMQFYNTISGYPIFESIV